MSTEKTTPVESAPEWMIVQMDTTKDGVKKCLEATAKLSGKLWSAQENHKLAVLRWIMDMLDVQDPDMRKQAAKQFMATPSGFGANASQMNQALGKKGALAEINDWAGV